MPNTSVRTEVEDLLDPQAPATVAQSVRRAGIRALPAIREILMRDLAIHDLERVEAMLKLVLHDIMRHPVDATVGRELALFQQHLGFLFKYKPYGLKASTPFGYSLFLLNQGEGFSFQRHVTRKTELFHVLDVKPGGYVFLCDYRQWQRSFTRERFARWLADQPDAIFDGFRFFPQAGDAYPIDRLNVVHAAIGCVLEEFATVSIDMVDRLFDQNADRTDPPRVGRATLDEELRHLNFPQRSYIVRRGSRTACPVIRSGQVQTQVLFKGDFRASHLSIPPWGASAPTRDQRRATTIHIAAGGGRLAIGTLKELSATSPPSIPMTQGDVLMVAPGLSYFYVNGESSALRASEHGIEVELAIGDVT